jgi:hypothetical protein
MARNLATGEELYRFSEKDGYGWDYYSYCCELSEDTIRENVSKVHWDLVSAAQELSEEFIIEFKDRVDWEAISACQYLSESFIQEYQDLIFFDRLVRNENLHSYSKEIQKLILLKLIQSNKTNIYKDRFTNYMKELYEKHKMFL